MWLLGVVVRSYIDFLIILIPTPLVSVLFRNSIPTFCSFIYIYIYIVWFLITVKVALLELLDLFYGHEYMTIIIVKILRELEITLSQLIIMRASFVQ